MILEWVLHISTQQLPATGSPPRRKVLFAVRFVDGSSEYIRVEPQTAVFGLVRVLPYAMKLQANGELRAGKILSIGRVR
jgi:hypothetical protein